MSAQAGASPFRLASRSGGIRPSAIREILKATAQPGVISFAGGLPAAELFPLEEVRRATQEALADDGPAALQYGLTEGYGPLREWIAADLAANSGLKVTAGEVLVVSGSQQGLDLVAKVLLDPGDLVLVENPCYLGAIQAFSAYEARLLGVACDEGGIRPEALRRAMESAPARPKLLYLTPRFQNPTGTSLAPSRQAEIVALAEEFGVPVLEDDPYGRLRYSGPPHQALGALAGTGGWLFLGSTSKFLAPGLRVGWLAVRDPAFFERLVSVKQAADLHTPGLTQRAAFHYLRRPDAVQAHVAILCHVYRRRRDAMLAALARHLPTGCRWTRPDGGLFLWLELPEGADALDLFGAARKQNVLFVPGESFWVGEPKRHTLRLNFSHADPERIDEGVRRLASAWAGLR
ncbi:MAG TPA: PLP-dependent aminotransferase family protein [Opitutaceae bacterium]|nr:PLP-dependent aminotransferase family protein [Opitutaceae bacterium]